ncbi:DUF4190 domain-containing protein [Rhodococcus sp. NPDC058532]|uniref:DUF4190 domain-containing protein n=1 Tax=Rhodococcus sp. NPDC058532 TaxID=3346540 RepID=UPI00364A4A06
MTNQPPNPDGTPEGQPPQYGPPGSGAAYPGGQPQYPGGQPYPGPPPQYGQPYPGQPYPGGQVPPGGYPPGGYQPQPSPRNGAGIAALILGVLAVLGVWTIVGGIVLGVLAVILGFVGRSQFKKRRATNGGMSLAGIILGALAVIVSIVLVVVGVGIFNKVGGRDLVDCLRDAGTDSAAIERCQDEFRQNVENQLSITLTPAPR